MEIEQLIKRLDWLDEERRKDKNTIASLESRLTSLEANITPVMQQLRDLSTELSRQSAMLARFDEIDAAIMQARVDASRALEAAEKQRAEHDREMEKVRRADMEALNKADGDLRKALEPLADLKKGLQTRVEEDYRLGRLIEELKAKIDETVRSDEEYKRMLRLVDEGRRQDTKRLSDAQGEVAALRKRLDEQRGKVDLTADSVRKMELRLGEIQAAETERRQTQATFVEKQTLVQVERDRSWKEMQARFDEITRQAMGLDSQLQALDATQRAVKRSQEAFDEITQRFERRVNEITEMQRLTEERFRQEWVSFKADDQKRWTNYTLAQDEQQREFSRQFDKSNERVVLLEDMTQELRDQLHQAIEETQKRLQALLAMTHTWVEDYSRTLGSGH